MEPSGLRSCRSLGDNALKGPKFTADMVEDAVENDPQTTTVCGIDQFVKIGIVAETLINPEIVDGVVTVRGRGENRPQQEPGRAEVDGVVQPRCDMAEAVDDARPVACLGFGARKSKRIDVPPQRAFDPILQSFSFWSRPAAKYLGRQILQQSGIVANLGRRSHEGNASAIEHVSMAGDL